MFLAPDVYHVGVASAPATGSRVRDLGSPESNEAGYRYASNLEFAHSLKGKLLLVHGTSDPTAHFQNTMKLADALIRAGKPYDLLVMPGQGHGLWARSEHVVYWREAVRRYFQEHLKP
jgi:dipeptidyl aminopeptidase/acylaminoacyl peptidase